MAVQAEALGLAPTHWEFQLPVASTAVAPEVVLNPGETVSPGIVLEVDGVGSIDWNALDREASLGVTSEEREVLLAALKDTSFAYALVEIGSLGRMTEAQASFDEHLNKPGLGGRIGSYVEGLRRAGTSKSWIEDPGLAVDLNQALWGATRSLRQPSDASV